MKTNEKKDLHTKTVAELKKLIVDAEKELVNLKLDLTQGKVKDTSSISNTRKKIAVLKTIVRIKAEAEKTVKKQEVKEDKK